MSDDALIGLWFEVGGGLGRMSGQVVGKARDLYLVRRDGSEHLELLQLDDLRSGRFYPKRPKGDATTAGKPSTSSNLHEAAPVQAADRDITPSDFVRTSNIPSMDTDAPARAQPVASGSPAPSASIVESAEPAAPRRRLFDQIRRAAPSRDADETSS